MDGAEKQGWKAAGISGASGGKSSVEADKDDSLSRWLEPECGGCELHAVPESMALFTWEYHLLFPCLPAEHIDIFLFIGEWPGCASFFAL